MNKFLTSNDPLYRCLRTIIQGIIGVVIAQLPTLLTGTPLDPVWQAFIVAITMAVLSPIMALMGDESEPTLFTDDDVTGDDWR